MAAIGVAVATGTTACGAGQISQTANQLPAVNGGNATATWGPVDLRNVQIIYPTSDAGDVFADGGPFEVSFSIANTGATEVYRLVAVDVSQSGAPADAKVTLSSQPTIAPGADIRAGNPANVRPDGSTPATSAATTSAATSSAAPSSSAAAEASESPDATSASSASSSASATSTALEPGEAHMTATLTNTGKSVAAGLTTELSFRFQVQRDGAWVDAGTVKVEAAVDAVALTERADAPRGGDGAEGEGGEAGGGH